MSQPPRNRPPTRRVSTGERPSTQAGKPSRNVNAPRRSDPFPIVLGAIIGALVIGLMVVVYLISSNNGSASGGQPTAVANIPPATVAPQNDNATLPADANATAGPTEEPA